MRGIRKALVTLVATGAVVAVGVGSAQAAQPTASAKAPVHTQSTVWPKVPNHKACEDLGMKVTKWGTEGSWMCTPNGDGTFRLEVVWV